MNKLLEVTSCILSQVPVVIVYFFCVVFHICSSNIQALGQVGVRIAIEFSVSFRVMGQGLNMKLIRKHLSLEHFILLMWSFAYLH